MSKEEEYHLLITHEINVKGRKYKKYLKPYEVVRGEEFEIILNIKNIGNIKFPGGKFEDFKIEWTGYAGVGVAITTFSEDEVPLIPEIDVNNEIKLGEIRDTPPVEGVAWIKFKIKPNDGKKTVLYVSEDTVVGDIWNGFVYVVNRENLNILNILESLYKKVKS